MSGPDLARVFNQLQGSAQQTWDASDPDVQRARRERAEETSLQAAAGPMTAADCIPRIAQAWKDGDYIRLLGLPPVEVDALGRACWECSDADVSRAYRKLSVLVHPDKPANQGSDDARVAFERLNAAHRLLRDPAKRRDELGKKLDEARAARMRAEGAVTPAERVALNAQRASQAQALRHSEGHELHTAMLQQTEARRAEASMRRQRKQKRRCDEETEPPEVVDARLGDGAASLRRPGVGDSDDDDDEVHRRLARIKNSRRRK